MKLLLASPEKQGQRKSDFCHAPLGEILTFPSECETQGLALVEAMASGTPVIAVRAVGSYDVLADGQCGVLVRRDEKAFADAVLSALADPGRLATMRRAARRIAQRYSMVAATDRLIEVYDQVLTRGPSPARPDVETRSVPRSY